MEKQIAVIGLGIFGTSVALALVKRNFSVLAIDCDPDAVENIQDRVTRTLIFDTTQKKALLDAEIDELDTVIVAIGNGSNPLIQHTTPELEFTRKGNIVADENGRTSMPRVFAGGDIVLGAATVILAMGQGRRAAAAINEMLTAKDVK